MSNLSTQIQLVRRPEGWPVEGDFRTVEVTYDAPAPGEVRVLNEFLSVDPYMRGRMNGVKTYIDPFALDETMTGGAVGRVVESASEDLPVGTLVLHQLGWRDIAQAPASQFRAVADVPGAPASVRLGILGLTGLTAYMGLVRIAPVVEGDTVFVSGAAGAVGTAAGQIARLLGASRVIGSAGSAEKVAMLTERYGYDVAFNYKDAPVREQLRQAAPDGIDVYFDNVGADHLEAAIGRLNRGGRAALCGAIADYNATEAPTGPRNLSRLITEGLTLRGFTIGDHPDLSKEFSERVGGWFAEGRIVYNETVVDGIENTVEAFLTMLRGGNVGKMVVRVS